MAPYSIPCTSKDVFTTLPPELLLQIWRDPELHLSPSSVAISRTLLPYARRNAYRQLHVDSDITLAALGERLALNPELGELVDEVEIKQEQSRGGDFGGGSAWLEASFVRAFEGLTRVQRISINRRDVGELLTPRIMSSAAFRSAGRLELASEESNIEWLALRYLHLSTGLRELEIKTPMKYQAGAPSGMFEPRTSRIEKLAISAEPHSADFESFFDHLSLVELDLRSGTTDAHRVFDSLGDSTRQNLRSLSFTSTGYHERNVDAALLGFHSLSHLSMTSTQLAITPTFFSTLSHLPLASLVFKGPRNPLLGHVLDWLSSGEQPKELKHLGVDVGVARGELPLWSTWRKEDDVSRLATVSAKVGVKLCGSICEALRLIPAM